MVQANRAALEEININQMLNEPGVFEARELGPQANGPREVSAAHVDGFVNLFEPMEEHSSAL